MMAGVCGGVLRGVFGIAKSAVLTKKIEINWMWFGVTVLISATVGIIAASFFGDDARLALLAGYVGADFIDGLINLKLKEVVDKGAEKLVKYKEKKVTETKDEQ